MKKEEYKDAKGKRDRIDDLVGVKNGEEFILTLLDKLDILAEGTDKDDLLKRFEVSDLDGANPYMFNENFF